MYNLANMNTLVLKKETARLEKSIQKANRTLLEFRVAQSKWEIKNGKYKIYSSVKALIRDAKKEG